VQINKGEIRGAEEKTTAMTPWGGAQGQVTDEVSEGEGGGCGLKGFALPA
jgi:hypothetical protein